MVANRPAVGPWETFKFIWLPGNTLALRALNGQHVCAENGGGREVVANRNDIGPWETFVWRVEGLAGDSVDRISLRASNGQFICAENGGGGEVVANRDSVGAWERFRLVSPPSSVLQIVGW